MNVLEVRACVLGGTFGKINVKYQATDAVKHSKILATLNAILPAKKEGDKDYKPKAYFTLEELNQHFGATPFKVKVIEVRMPEVNIPAVGTEFSIGSQAASLF